MKHQIVYCNLPGIGFAGSVTYWIVIRQNKSPLSSEQWTLIGGITKNGRRKQEKEVAAKNGGDVVVVTMWLVN